MLHQHRILLKMTPIYRCGPGSSARYNKSENIFCDVCYAGRPTKKKMFKQ